MTPKIYPCTAAPLILVQTGSVGSQVANVSLQSTVSGLVIKQCPFLFDDIFDSLKHAFQINGKCYCYCYNTIIAIVASVHVSENDVSLLMIYQALEELSYFIGEDFNHYLL